MSIPIIETGKLLMKVNAESENKGNQNLIKPINKGIKKENQQRKLALQNYFLK